MRIFVAGASGVIGRHLVPLLIEAGHEVAGTTRSEAKAASIAAQGAQPIVVDVYDADDLRDAVVSFGAEAVVHELTDLPDDPDLLPEYAAANSRIRIEGTANLIAAAKAVGATRFLAQSLAWELPPGPGADGVAALERQVLEFGGTVLRYGQLYGPETYFSDRLPTEPRVSLETAARLTIDALEMPPGILVITDEGIRPAEVPPAAPSAEPFPGGGD